MRHRRYNTVFASPCLLALSLCTCACLVGCGLAAPAPESTAKHPPSERSNAVPHVLVRRVGPDGRLGNPTETPALVLSDAEWRKRLTPEQYRVVRGKGTENAFCGGLLKNKQPGLYVCIGCNLPLFESGAKFESGTGWPSFFQPVAKENIREERDVNHGMTRIEILCQRCGAHLGHVFDDGPPPTGRRYCLNSESLRFVPNEQRKSLHEPAASPANRAEAVFAGGCFWCVEAVFRQIDGVLEVTSGYTGGTPDTAHYKTVASGRTSHAESVRIIYDPRKVSYQQLLKIHFATHDPTTLNRQGHDIGPQYRSAVFYANAEQREQADKVIAELNASKAYPRAIVTKLEPLQTFYPAEPEHQDYVTCNAANPYVEAVAIPKLKKVRKTFPSLIKSP